MVKPLDLAAFEQTVTGLLGQRADAPREVQAEEENPLQTGSSRAMQPVFKALAAACASDAPVLLRGPSGSGKTLAARVIHTHSHRAAGPFVTLDCAGLSGMHLESELFGHERGAFPGATASREGLLEKAHGGTLLLDEVANLPADVQAKLLRFVEEKTFLPPGGSAERRIDVRLIAATQCDLAAEVAAGRFRKDLYFRLNVIEISLPALRQRLEDVPALAEALLARIAPGRHLRLAPEVLTRLRNYDWPGHVRELRNVLEHAAAQSTGAVLQLPHLPPALRGGPDTAAIDRRLDNALDAWLSMRLKQPGIRYDALHGELEGRLLAALLPHFDNRPTRLAAALDMNRNTLRKRLGRDPSAGE
jgi:DNA-binding NtrC family response regulator